MQYNPEEFEEILNIFKAESEEIIQKLNDRFMELEKKPEDKTPIKELFQLAHSLKGGARMIGFNGVQDISHKLEDILSYWKEDNAEINTDFFQVIYKVCDFLSELVEKSVRKKADCKDENVVVFLDKLNDFISNNAVISDETTAKPLDYIVNKEMDINAILLELMFVLEKEDIDVDYEDSIEVLKDNFEQLAEIFTHTDFNEVKEKIAFLITFIADSSNQETDISFLKRRIIELRTMIYNLYKELNVMSVARKTPYKRNTAIKKNEAQKTNTDSLDDDKIINDNFDFILANLQKIKTDKNYLKEISNKLKIISNCTKDGRISVILSKVINIFKQAETKNRSFDNECYMVLLQGIFLAKRLSLKDKNDYENNYNSLLQRLIVVEDMFNISSTSTSTNAVNKNITPVIKEKGNVLTSNNEEINQKLKAIDLNEIKTLRVDTTKLDNLISQTGELLINGIKTREHIIELARINTKLIKWNGVSKKILSYLKYLEKKGFFSDMDDGTNIFYRRTQQFFADNADLINDINNDFNNLYNIISEDDNKLHQTTMEIEAIAKGIRVLPLATLFHSFPRMIRDIATENNKKIDFIISGSDTAVDKKIIEEIKMPLIHILRNSVSHGIELPEERIKHGKNETGTVKLTSKQEENNVIISIEDDGYGVNIEKVKEKALEKGLLTEEEIVHMDSKQLMKLLFFPGFSTEENVTEISGRGVGLDVVKTKITNLNGEILIDSVLNKGCKVTIRLPLSMSTIKTFILLVNGQKYAIPVNTIKFVAQIKKEQVFEKNGIKSIIYDNHSIPVYSLSNLLGEPNTIEQSSHLTVIIIESHEKQTAYIVDKLIGDQEVFQKKLVLPILRIKNISGFTILPTGELCLIINPYELVRNTH